MYELLVRPFYMGTDKEAAIKVLKEASKVREAWQTYTLMTKYKHFQANEQRVVFADELTDVIQAACNLADRYGIDLASAMERCEERNRAGGWYE